MNEHVLNWCFGIFLVLTTLWWIFHPAACFLPWQCF